MVFVTERRERGITEPVLRVLTHTEEETRVPRVSCHWVLDHPAVENFPMLEK